MVDATEGRSEEDGGEEEAWATKEGAMRGPAERCGAWEGWRGVRWAGGRRRCGGERERDGCTSSSSSDVVGWVGVEQVFVRGLRMVGDAVVVVEGRTAVCRMWLRLVVVE